MVKGKPLKKIPTWFCRPDPPMKNSVSQLPHQGAWNHPLKREHAGLTKEDSFRVEDSSRGLRDHLGVGNGITSSLSLTIFHATLPPASTSMPTHKPGLNHSADSFLVSSPFASFRPSARLTFRSGARVAAVYGGADAIPQMRKFAAGVEVVVCRSDRTTILFAGGGGGSWASVFFCGLGRACCRCKGFFGSFFFGGGLVSVESGFLKFSGSCL